MSLRINDEAPNFTAKTTQGDINFHAWIGDQWAVLFSHPKDFTPVCTTELGYMAGLESEFKKRNCKIIGLSVDPVENHTEWAKDIEETQGHAVNYPMIGDSELKIAKLYNMLPADESGTSEGRTAINNATVRSVFIVGPDKKIKLMLTYPMTTGRNFDEILRVLDSMQLTGKHKVATPVNWKNGDDVIIVPAVSDDEAKNIFPDGWVARIRVYGEIEIKKNNFGNKIVNLTSLLNGASIIGCNNEHFGRAENILAPGKGKNMGDGWETRRSRGKNFDWLIIKLGCPGMINKIEIDTHHFKGNYPDKCSLQAAYIPKKISNNSIINKSIKWKSMLNKVNLNANKKHNFNNKIMKNNKINFIRINIYPDGGISRVRAFGKVIKWKSL